MNKVNKINSTIILLCLHLFVFGQMQNENPRYEWYDKVIGKEHTGLYNGKQYIDFDRNKILDNKHAFFNSDAVLRGSVNYDGQTYYNVGIKYNLEIQNLLVTLKSGSVASILQLIYDKIDEFTIEDSSFIKIENLLVDGITTSGFVEVLLENSSFSLLKQHKKRRREYIKGQQLYYKFLDKSRYILFINSTYIHIKSKGDVIKAFPDYKKEIKLFYDNYKSIKESNYNAFMKQLFKQISHSSSSSK
ncbi:hypothetical protein [uncultured Aquimarina sp.]|uniref:hypothetical protein n=1 Tax=uncultured Aquimarina sp. TaxID=575652 RepID=UPI00261B56C8|nr:hypothetical protein [uncultured Aquimarina sp.]